MLSRACVYTYGAFQVRRGKTLAQISHQLIAGRADQQSSCGVSGEVYLISLPANSLEELFGSFIKTCAVVEDNQQNTGKSPDLKIDEQLLPGGFALDPSDFLLPTFCQPNPWYRTVRKGARR